MLKQVCPLFKCFHSISPSTPKEQVERLKDGDEGDGGVGNDNDNGDASCEKLFVLPLSRGKAPLNLLIDRDQPPLPGKVSQIFAGY